MSLKDEVQENLIFSLDIGTRTIIGIVLEYNEDETFTILGHSIKEHKQRNMYDGQIHDIEGVSKVVKEIIADLEEQVGKKLKVVSIAAAGRALKTHKVRVERMINKTNEISKFNIETLELEAVQKAQEEINNIETGTNFRYYSIGYTIIDYYLDEEVIGNLEGHKGERIGVELLATFLPQIVIEGLYSVMSRVGLEVGSITLEPIAAINIAIKKELRLLNLSLVDIGAGTSDIAITKEGHIISYAMTQTAGDEITESLSQEYLLDFNTSEKLKVQLSEKKEHEFKDIVGVSYRLSTEEIVEKIIHTIEKIANEIVEKILKYNGKAPNAIFLIGGSSQMPMLKEIIAEKLGLPKERVAIRDTSSIENINGLDTITGPHMITPIGIAVEGLQQKYRNFIKITFNGEEIRVFNTENIKISDILIMTNYSPRKLMPKRAEDFIYYVNGKKRSIKGKEGSLPMILMDGKESTLQTKLYNGAVIKVISSKTEEIKAPFIHEVIPTDLSVENVLVNGKRVEKDYILKMKDEITIIEEELNKEKETNIKENEIKRKKHRNNIRLTVNENEMDINHNKDNFIFVDIFDYIDFDLTNSRGKLVLKINGREAEYMEELKNGDHIKIYWE